METTRRHSAHRKTSLPEGGTFRPKRKESAPVFKKRNSSFTSSSEEPVLCYYQQALHGLMTCIGMERVQVQNILAQIDFLLEQKDHERLARATTLEDEEISILESLAHNTWELLQSQDEVHAAITIQTLARGWLIRKPLKLLRKEDKSILRIRTAKFSELIRDHRVQLTQLAEVVERFLRPISEDYKALGLNTTAVNYLCADFQAVASIVQTILEHLESVQENPRYPLMMPLGPALLEVMAMLRSSVLAYADNLTPCKEALQHLRKTVPRFQSFLDEAETASKSTLEENYQLPLAYIETFVSKLEQIQDCAVKATKEEGWPLERSISSIREIVAESQQIIAEDEQPAQRENIRRTLMVELTLEGLESALLGIPGRKFIREGGIKISKRKNSYLLYLFSDIILIAEKTLNSNKLDLIIYPSQLSLEESGGKLRFFIDRNGGTVEEVISFKNKNEKADWRTALDNFILTYQANRVYGIPIEEVVVREKSPEGVPLLMVHTMRFVKEFGMASEGIFRIPGDVVVIAAWKRLFDCGQAGEDFRGCSVHDVAALFKLYLRELPEPLFPFSLYNKLMQIQGDYERTEDKQALIEEAAKIVSSLTTCRQNVLYELLLFLADVGKYARTTKMDIANLATVFAPNVMRPEKESLDTAMQLAGLTNLFYFFIINCEDIWAASNIQIIEEESESPLVRARAPSLVRIESKYSLQSADPVPYGDIPSPATMRQRKDSIDIDFSKLQSKHAAKPPKQRTTTKTSPRRRRKRPSQLVQELQAAGVDQEATLRDKSRTRKKEEHRRRKEAGMSLDDDKKKKKGILGFISPRHSAPRPASGDMSSADCDQ